MFDSSTLTEVLVKRKNEKQKGISFILSRSEEIRISYADIYETSLKILYNLQKQGFRQGDEVVFQIADSRIFIFSFWACILGGMIPVPIVVGANDEQKFKLFKIWGILKRPRLIATADIVGKFKEFAHANGLDNTMNEILQRVFYAGEEIPEKYGEIHYPKSEDTAFIQFSSGSTGDPKGVIITHKNIMTNISAIMRWSRLTPDDVSLFWMPLTHDMGLIGAHIKDIIIGIDEYCIDTQLFIKDPVLWLEKTNEHRATLLYSPNFGYKHFMEYFKKSEKPSWDLSCVKIIYNGAEPISMEVCDEFLDEMDKYGLKRTAMYPAYGLAEGTIACTFPIPGEKFVFHTLKRSHLHIGEAIKDTFEGDADAVTLMDVGYPIYDCNVRIFDDDGKDLGEEHIGHIKIKGGNVTSGYYNNEEATREAISADGWLDTGDLGFLRNGRLTITGRAKDVIFVAGQNFYSNDIERIAEKCEYITPGTVAAVGAFNKSTKSDELILFVVTEKSLEQFAPTAQSLKKTVSEKLNIEAAEVIPIKAMPKTSSGKVQHFKLKESFLAGDFDIVRQKLRSMMAQSFNQRQIELPKTPTEKKMAKIWSEILGIEKIGIHDNFFALGGDSIKITQLLSRIRETFNVETEQAALYDNPEIEKLSALVDTLIEGSKVKEEKIQRIFKSGEKAPLSFAQQRLWFLDKLNSNSPQYNIYSGLVIKGKLDKEALIKSFNAVMDRHTVMQMSFVEEDGLPVAVISKDKGFKLSETDLRSVDENKRMDAAREIAEKEAAIPFRLDNGPLIRGRLICTGYNEYILVLVAHHIIFDGWSFGILLRELSFYYNGFVSGSNDKLPEMAIQYADYAAWQKNRAQSGALDSQIEYWKKKLGGNLPVLDLPTDRPRPAVQTFAGKKITGDIPQDLLDRVRACTEKENVTLFMVLYAAFNVLLYRYTGQTDIILGSPIANRNTKQIESLIGFFTNDIILRTTFSEEDKFDDLLQNVKNVTLEAYANQDVPFEKIVEELHVERNMSANPLFQVLFGMQISPFDNVNFKDINISTMDIGGKYSRFDLSCDVRETGDGLALDFEFSTDLFDDSTIIRFARQYRHLLETVAENPEMRIDKIDILTNEDKAILDKVNNTYQEFPDGSWIKLFEKQAEKTPDAVAAVCAEQSVSYRELNERANRLANYLVLNGAGPESVLGIYMNRSVSMLVGLLGIHKAGAAYMPMDPIYPRERLKYMLEDAKVKLILSEDEISKSLPENSARVICLDKEWDSISKMSAEAPDIKTTGADLAYLIYTSGSTGKPKGVQIEQHSLKNFLCSMAQKIGMSASDTLLAVTTLSFDIAGLEMYLPLICGAKIVIARREEVIDGKRLIELIKNNNITVMQATPATWRLLEEDGWQGTKGMTALCGGEAFPRELADMLLKRCARVFNVYGPTETTIWSTLDEIKAGEGPVMIGKPIANTTVYVLDKAKNRVPVGVPGELYIGGAGLSRGYLNLPELTAQRFVPNPFCKDGGRIYATGDLVKFAADGRLECIGRIDNQVKIRGFRIELGEIESLLKKNPEIKNCIVADKEVIKGEKSLVAYIIPANGKNSAKLSAQYLRESIKDALPGYMIPSAFVIMDSYPMTPNGKIDRKALPVPAKIGDKAQTEINFNDAERKVAEIWREVLKRDDIGVNQNFFDVGGHSLLLAQVRSKIEKVFGADISMMDLFKYPTIRTLAEFLSGDSEEEQQSGFAENSLKSGDIAVIGLSGRFPGANNIDEFWKNLCDGKESISRFSDKEVIDSGVSPETLKKPGYVKAWGTIDDVDKFDAEFFGFNPREAEMLDPQQRIFLEEVFKAIQNAGYDTEKLGGSVGIFASVGMNTYADGLKKVYGADGLAANYQIMTSNDKDFLATRAAYKLGLRGPALTVQTACSSSMVAVHLACRSLLSGECDMAAAGGVSVRLPQKSGYLYQDGMILSPDGHCRAFDKNAKGTVGGNGAGVVILKRLEDALRDGDTISAVIKGTAVNNDGSQKVGYTAPTIDGQAGVIAAAQQKAGINPETVTYVETHGTGTPLGDPIEIEALKKVFQSKTDKKHFCALGSVKTNIGHLDAASGISGFIKTVLSLKNKKIPASLNFESPNPKIDFENSPFYVNTRLKEWESDSLPRRAGISSFGIGGTNVHAVLEEAPVLQSDVADGTPSLLLFSAKDKKALERMTDNFLEFLKKNPDINIRDAAYTLQMGRREFQVRRYLVCTDTADAIKALSDKNANPKRVFDNINKGAQAHSNLTGLDAIGQKWLAGDKIDWSALYKGERRKRIPLPSYPLEKQSYWYQEPAKSQENVKTAKNPDIGQWFYTPVWKQSADSTGAAEPRIDAGEAMLVLKSDNDFSNKLAARIKSRYAASVAIAGDGYGKIDGGYTFDAENFEDYKTIISEITAGKKSLRIINLLGVTGRLSDKEALENGELLFDSMINTAKALGDISWKNPTQIKAVTDNSQKIFGESEVYPQKVLHLGACRVIPIEYANIKCQSIDVLTEENSEFAIDVLINELFSNSQERVAAYRGAFRWIQNYEKTGLRAGANPALKIKDGGTYLITGGLGGVGLIIAGFLAQKAKVNLVLTGRSQFPDESEWDNWLSQHAPKDTVSRKIQKLRALKSMGAQIMICRADVTDKEQMNSLRGQIESRFEKLDGIIHAAGRPGGGMIQLKNKEESRAVFAPKVTGTQVLYDTFKDQNLDFILLCSSLNAITGGFGQVDYSGANAFLDAFAQKYNTADTRVLSVDWDRFPGIGMSAKTSSVSGEEHPILGRVIAQNDSQAVFMNRLGPDKDWVLSEHKVIGIPTIAGSTYIEMARAAFEEITGFQKAEISDVVFMNPLAVKDGEYRRVFTVLNKKANGYEFEIISVGDTDGSADFLEHAEGKIAQCGENSGKAYDITELKMKCSQKEVFNVNGSSKVSEQFISFGGRWRSLVSYNVGNSAGLAFIRLDDSYKADIAACALHPALLDEATGVIRIATGKNYLPFFYKKLRMFAPLTAEIYSYVRYEGAYDDAPNTITCDIDILGRDGAVLAQITGFSMKRIAEASAVGTQSETARAAYKAQFGYLERAYREAGAVSILDEGISADEGQKVMERLANGCYRAQVIVSTKDLETAMKQANYAEQADAATLVHDEEENIQKHPRPELETEYVAPTNETEEKIAALWQNILGIDKIGIYDDFFALGGDSLLLIQLYSKLKEKFDTDVAVVDLYKYNTIALLAKHISGGTKQEEKPNFEKVNNRANKRLEYLRKKKLMQRKKRDDSDE